MPIAQDKLSKFGINLRGECQLCSLLLHCIQHSATQQNMGHKMQGCFLNLMKFSKGSKTFFLSYSCVVPIFAVRSFQWSEENIASGTKGWHFLAGFQFGSRFHQFWRFLFFWVAHMPISLFNFLTKLSHDHFEKFHALKVIDISIFKLVLTFPILAWNLLLPDQFRDLMNFVKEFGWDVRLDHNFVGGREIIN